MIMIDPKKVKLELMSDEIENIIQELESAQQNLYKFLRYDKTINKLKEALKKK